MDHMILGILLLGSRTIYQLRERVNKGLHLMYSSSMGSIQAALKKLQEKGFIRYEETVENGKYKKIYSITDSGKQYFSEWVNSPIEAYHARNPELGKVYFMGFSEEKNRKKNLERYLSYLEEQYDVLNAICEEAGNIRVPADCEDIFFYQLAAARYGRDFMKFNIGWYQNLLKEIGN